MQAEQEALVRRLQAGFDNGVDVLFDGQRIVGRRPEVQVVPQSAVRSRDTTHGMLPKVSLPIVVIDVAGDTGFMLELGHTGGQQARSPDRNGQVFAALTIWVTRGSSDTSLTPSLLAKVSPQTAPELEAALSAVGIDRPESGEKSRGGEPRPDHQRPTWLPWEPLLNGPIVRGALDEVAFSVHGGEALVVLLRPRGYRPRGGARLVLQSPPAALPLTPTAAKRIHQGGSAHPRGLAVNIATPSPWSLRLRLPDQQTALEDWASDHGYAVEEPPPGMDARALLQRLGDLQRLDALAGEANLEVLVTLAPLARDQLAKKLAKAFAPSGDRERLADELIEKLRVEGLLLELAGQTVEQLKSALPRYKLPEIVAAIAGLVEAGFVQRGRHAECPRCQFALRAGHHPRGRVTVAVAAGAVEPSGAQRVARDQPQRDLVARAHDATLVIVADPRPPGRREHPERRVREQLAVTVRRRVVDRVQQRLVTGCGLQVERFEDMRRELREMGVARPERVAVLLLNASREAPRVLGAAQPCFADLAHRPLQGVLAGLERVDEDPGDGLAQPGMVIACPRGLLALAVHRGAGVPLGVLYPGRVQVDQLVAALDEGVRAERQQHRQAPRCGEAREAPTPGGAGPRWRGRRRRPSSEPRHPGQPRARQLARPLRPRPPATAGRPTPAATPVDEDERATPTPPLGVSGDKH
jgi:hypothetical protein